MDSLRTTPYVTIKYRNIFFQPRVSSWINFRKHHNFFQGNWKKKSRGKKISGSDCYVCASIWEEIIFFFCSFLIQVQSQYLFEATNTLHITWIWWWRIMALLILSICIHIGNAFYIPYLILQLYWEKTKFNTQTLFQFGVLSSLFFFHFSYLSYDLLCVFTFLYFLHSFPFLIFIHPSAVYVFYQFSPFRLFSLILLLLSVCGNCSVFLCFVYEAIKWVFERHPIFLSGKMREKFIYEANPGEDAHTHTHVLIAGGSSTDGRNDEN